MLHGLLPSQEGQPEALSLLRTTGPITNSPQIPPDQTRGSYLCHMYTLKSAVSIFYSEPTVLQALSKWQTGTSLTYRTGTLHRYSQQTRAEFASGSMQEAEGGKQRHALLPVRVSWHGTGSSCCLCYWYSFGSSAGDCAPHTEVSQSQQAEAEHTAAPLHPTQLSEGAARSHHKKGSTAAHIQTLSLAGYTRYCGTVGSMRLKKYSWTTGDARNPPLYSKKASSSDWVKAIFMMLLSKAAAKEKDLASIWQSGRNLLGKKQGSSEPYG